MAEIKNYLSYEGLKFYDELIKQYIATADEAVLNQILGEIKDGDATTIAALNELLRNTTGTAGTALQQITKGEDGQFVITTVSEKGEGTTQSVSVSVTTAAISGTEDGLVTASDVRTELDGKVDKEDGKDLSANDFTDALKTKLEGLANIKSVGDNLDVDDDGKLTVTIPEVPEADVTGVDEKTVDGLKLQLTDKKVTLVDDGLAATLAGKTVTVRKKDGTTDDQCVYEILQGETVVGTINHPKELVVTAGEVIVASNEKGLTTGEKYLKLTIANQEAPVYIAVKDLVDAYTEGAGISISDANVVSVKLAETQGNVVLDITNGLKASVDLSGYYTSSETDTLLSAKQDAMVAITDAEIEALFAEETPEDEVTIQE